MKTRTEKINMTDRTETCQNQNKTENKEAKNIRVRIRYEKRGGACFVPHVSLINLFTRSALRAGLSLTRTEGFSPHPKISFGPELPAGVVALGELVDVHFEQKQFFSAANVDEWLMPCIERWNKALPEGFRFLGATLPSEGSPVLGKSLHAAVYWVRGVKATRDELTASAKNFYGSAVLDARAGQIDTEYIKGADDSKWFSLTLAAPAQNGIGGWVRAMLASGMIAGWHELNIVRAGMILRS